MSAIVIKQIESLDEVEADAWDACAGGADGASPPNPFVSHAFLKALEDAGCVDGRSGWKSRHVVLERGGTVLAAAPCYLKSHSQGEYVFDHAWAHALERAGGDYYPKLQVSVPFTPATGPRLLVRPDAGEGIRETLAAGLAQVAVKMGVSSLHVTFAEEAETRTLEGLGYLHRTDQQFHWLNDGHATYDDFLATLASRKRKALKRERREALNGGIVIEWVTGDDLDEARWNAFFRFYMDTASRKWGQPYLNRRFFSLLGERMGDRVVLVMAKREGRYVAGALNVVGRDAIYGRYWGCVEEHPFLHFEVCYHQAIDYAIAHKLRRVEAGAQGGHKLARGYVPTTTHSAHFIADQGFRRAVADYLKQERRAVSEQQRELLRFAPYRRGEVGGGAPRSAASTAEGPGSEGLG